MITKSRLNTKHLGQTCPCSEVIMKNVASAQNIVAVSGLNLDLLWTTTRNYLKNLIGKK